MNSTLSDDSIKLSGLPVGSRGTIKQVMGGRQLVHRLLSLGLRVGSEIEIVQHRGSGVVVACQGNRVALGGGVADKLLLNPIDATA
ncbi:MAG: ferrous iron transport protein A [Candidatus Thiodiazotropha sp. (ex Ctena orbiculata)]|nr:ferrous iron transport protein A [Candidatus Thiodiazotropha taylori]